MNIDIRRRGDKGYIVLRTRYQGSPVVVHTGEQIPLSQWDAKRKRPKANQAMYMRIEAMRTEMLRDPLAYRKAISGIPVGQQTDLADFWEGVIDGRDGAPGYEAATIQTYRRSLRKLRLYKAHKHIEMLAFNSVSLDFFQDFGKWMHGLGASMDYAAKTIGHLVDALEEAEDRGLYSGTVHRSPKLRVKTAAPNRAPIYLSESELEQFAALSLTKTLQMVRDGFLVSACTGVRFSDLTKVRAAAISTFRGRKVIRLVMQKTGKETALPVSAQLLEILDRYPDGLPAYSIQYANMMIKHIARLAGVPDEKAAAVTTHTARRSFATNEYLLAIAQGRSYAPIMRALGHSSEKTFFRYIRLSAFENADLLQRAG